MFSSSSGLGKSAELMLLLRLYLSEHPEGATLRKTCKWLAPLIRGVQRELYSILTRHKTYDNLVKRHLGFIGATISGTRYCLSHSTDAPSAATLEATLTTVKQRVAGGACSFHTSAELTTL